jgi:hypothetical protein
MQNRQREKNIGDPDISYYKPEKIVCSKTWQTYQVIYEIFSGSTRFFSVKVRFSFFSFRLIKPKPNRSGQFF